MKATPLFAYGIRYLLAFRGNVAVPLANAWRRLKIARASGTERTKQLAALAWWQGDGPEAIEHWRVLEREEPTNVTWPIRIAQAVKEGGEFDEAHRVLRDARERGIQSEALELDLLRYNRLSRSSNSALADDDAIVADPAASDAKVFYAAFHLMAQNRLDSARIGMERVRNSPDYKMHARGHLAAIDTLARARKDGRAEFPGRLSPSLNSVVVREPSSDTLIVGFTLGEGTMGLPVNAVHAMLSSRGVNGLYLYDSRQIYHLDGSDRFGSGYQAMLDGIRALAAELGVRRVIVTGSSATGYTAIRVALDLNADGAIVFSPATMMLTSSKTANARGAYNLYRLRKYVRPMMINMRDLLKSRKNVPQIELYFGSSNTRDVMHAGNVSDIAGVKLHPVEGFVRHDCLTEMAYRGYSDLLKAFEAK